MGHKVFCKHFFLNFKKGVLAISFEIKAIFGLSLKEVQQNT